MNENDMIEHEESNPSILDESFMEVKVSLNETDGAKEDLINVKISYSTSNTDKYLSKTEALEYLRKLIKQIIDGENK